MHPALIAILAFIHFTEVSSSFSEGLVITSSQSMGALYDTRRLCTSEPLRDLNGKIYSDFKVSRTGASWEASTVILSQDAQFDLDGDLDTDLPIGLRLTLGFVGRKHKTWIQAVNIANAKIPSQGKLSGNASYCGIPAPDCFKKEKCYAMKPPFGWGSSLKKSSRKPAASVVDLNLTGVVSPNDIEVQLWAVPDGVSRHGRWDTPIFTILNWKFINFDGSEESNFDEDEEEEEDEEDSTDWSGGGSQDEFSGFDGSSGLDGNPDESSSRESDDYEDEPAGAPPPTIPPPVTMADKVARNNCPVWQHMSCVLDVLEKTCYKDEGSPRKLITHKHPENVWLCCCPFPYKSCGAGERNAVCDKALKDYITPLGKRPSTKAIQTALQDARGAMRSASGSACSSSTVPAKPYSGCGRKADPPVERALARQELFCEIITWQQEELGDGFQEEFEANGCPWPAHPGKPGDGKWRKGASDWSGH